MINDHWLYLMNHLQYLIVCLQQTIIEMKLKKKMSSDINNNLYKEIKFQ